MIYLKMLFLCFTFALIAEGNSVEEWIKKVELSPHSIAQAPKNIRLNKQVVLAAVKKNGLVLGHIDLMYRLDQDVVMAAVKNNETALQYALGPTKRDRAIVYEALKNSHRALHYVDKSYKHDKAFARYILQKYGILINYFDEKILNDPEFVNLAIKSNPNTLIYVPLKFRDDPKLALDCVKRGLHIKHLSKHFYSKRSFITESSKHHGDTLQYADKTLRSDPEIIKHAVTLCIDAIQWADPSFRSDKQLILFGLNKSKLNTYNAPLNSVIDKTFLKDRELIKAAINFRWWWLSDLEQYKSDREIVLIALKKSVEAIFHMDKKFYKDQSIMKSIISRKPEYLKFDQSNLKDNKAFMKKLLEKEPDYFQMAGEKLRNDPDFCTQFILKRPHLLQYCGPAVKADKALVSNILKKDFGYTVFQYADKSIQANDELVLKALKKSPEMIAYLSKDLLNNKKYIQEAINSWVHSNKLNDHFFNIKTTFLNKIGQIPWVKKDRDLILKLCKAKQNVVIHSFIIRSSAPPPPAYIGPLSFAIEFRNDLEIVRAALKQSLYAFKYVGEKLKQDKAFITEFLSSSNLPITNFYQFNTPFLVGIPESFFEDRELMFKLIKKNVKLLIYDKSSIREDVKIMTELLELHKSDYVFLLSLNKSALKENEKLMFKIITDTPNCVHYLSKRLLKKESFILKAIEKNEDVFQYVKHEYKHNTAFMKKAVQLNPRIIKFLQYNTNRELLNVAIDLLQKELDNHLSK